MLREANRKARLVGQWQLQGESRLPRRSSCPTRTRRRLLAQLIARMEKEGAHAPAVGARKEQEEVPPTAGHEHGKETGHPAATMEALTPTRIATGAGCETQQTPRRFGCKIAHWHHLPGRTQRRSNETRASSTRLHRDRYFGPSLLGLYSPDVEQREVTSIASGAAPRSGLRDPLRPRGRSTAWVWICVASLVAQSFSAEPSAIAQASRSRIRRCPAPQARTNALRASAPKRSLAALALRRINGVSRGLLISGRRLACYCVPADDVPRHIRTKLFDAYTPAAFPLYPKRLLLRDTFAPGHPMAHQSRRAAEPLRKLLLADFGHKCAE